MTLFNKILVPHDFSEHAQRALETAIDLAQRYDASLSVLHVYQPVLFAVPDGFILYPPQELLALLDGFNKQVAQQVDRARAAGLKLVDGEVLQGRPVIEIVERARARSHDLIVMGTHGRTGIAHALIGSTAEHVVRRAPCAVLTVH